MKSREDRKNSPFEERKKFCPFSQKNSPQKHQFACSKWIFDQLSTKNNRFLILRSKNYAFSFSDVGSSKTSNEK